MILANGITNTQLPIKQFGGGIQQIRAGWTRITEFKAHHFTSAWVDKIPNSSTTPYVLPYKVTPATPPIPPVPPLTGGVYIPVYRSRRR